MTATKPDLIQFRPGLLAEQLTARTRDQSFDLLAKRDLERYYTVLQNELRRVSLSEPEAMLIVDALNGILFADSASLRFLAAEVEEGIDMDDLDRKWGVDRSALSAKLKAFTPAQSVAIIDAVERLRIEHGADLAADLRAVGLIR